VSSPDPWADPSTRTQPGAPYAGPPATAPAPPWRAPYGAPGYGAPPWPAYGPPWAPPPRNRRPGQVVAAAVLAFVQAGLVALSSAYLFLLASVFTLAVGEPGFPGDAEGLATEATVLAAVQIASVVALVVGGVMALNRRAPASRWTLLAALAVQLVLALYWAVRLLVLVDDALGADPAAVLLFGAFCFAVAPAVALGLLAGRPARAWFRGPDAG
jgi:hypothetical protein